MLLVQQGLAISALNIKQGLHVICMLLTDKSAAKKQAIGYWFTNLFFFPPHFPSPQGENSEGLFLCLEVACCRTLLFLQRYNVLAFYIE